MQTSGSHPQVVKCSLCFADLGSVGSNLGEIKLFKGSLSFCRDGKSTWQAQPVQKFICAQLLAVTRSQVATKFIVYNGNLEETKEALLVRSCIDFSIAVKCCLCDLALGFQSGPDVFKHI